MKISKKEMIVLSILSIIGVLSLFFDDSILLSLDNIKNNYLDIYYQMEGIFNEVEINSIIYRVLYFFAKMSFYFYHH